MNKFLAILSLLIVSLAAAFPANGAAIVNASSPLSQPGRSPAQAESALSYRYAATYGTPGEPYPDTPGYLNGPGGMYLDASNNLYAAEDSRVVKFDPAGNVLLTIGKGGACDVLCGLQDLAVDGAGNIWVVSNYGLSKFSSTGAFLAKFNGWENYPSQPLGFGGLQGIAFDNQGRMFLADHHRHRVLVYTFSGDTPVYSATIGVDNQPGSDSGHFNNPVGVAVDSSGRLYVDDGSTNSRVMRCIQGVGSWSCTQFYAGVGPHQGMENVMRLWISSSDQVYIINPLGNNVVRCTTAGTCSDLIDTTAYVYLKDIVADSAGNVFLSDQQDYAIRKYDHNGASLGVFAGTPGVPYLTDNQHLASPSGIAVDGNGDLAVLAGAQLIKMKPDGTRLWEYGTAGLSLPLTPGLMFNSVEVNVDSSNAFYVASQLQVDILNGNGTYIDKLGTGCCGGDYGFFFNQGVAVDPLTGTIYASDTGTDRVQVYNSAREYQASLGESGVPGSDNAHFNDPQAIAVDQVGNIYVVDRGNSRIQKFNSARVYQKTFSFTFTHEVGNLVVDSQGRLFIAEGNRVYVYDADGLYLTTIGGKDLGTDFVAVSSVAVDSAGSVYIASRYNHCVVKYVPGTPEWQQINISGFNNTGPGYGEQWSMEVFAGSLYAGGYANSAAIWRLSSGQIQWQAFNPAWSADNNVVTDMQAYGVYLYAGTMNQLGAELWRTNGTTWEQVAAGGFGDANNNAIHGMAAFNGSLYAVTSRSDGVAQIWRSPSGDAGSWSQVAAGGAFGSGGISAGISSAMTMAVYNGALYLGLSRNNVAELWRTSNGADWTPVFTNGLGAANTHVSAMAVFNGNFYIGMSNVTTGGSLWRSSTGTDFSQVFTNGLGSQANSRPYGLTVFSGQLYLTFNATPGVEVWRSPNGTAWSRIAANEWGNASQGATSPYLDKSMVVFDGYLHVSTLGAGGGGQLWRYNLYNQAPLMAKVLPGRGRTDQPNDLHVVGQNFNAQTTLTLETTPPEVLPVQFVSDTDLIASVPLGLTAGVYALTLQNPHSNFSTYPGAYSLNPPAEIDLSASASGFWTDPITPIEGQPMHVGLNVHRDGGSSPLTNVKVRFYNGNPASGGILIGDGTIPTLDPRGDFPTSAVTWAGTAQGVYTLFAVIDPDVAVDETDKSNNTVSRQVTVLPLSADSVPPSVNSFSINNGSQLTTTTAITLTAAVSDPSPSSGVAFVRYSEYEYSQGAGGWIEVKSSAWLPYAASSSNYAWTLDPVPGLHYLRVWGSDRARNASQVPGSAYINYMPAGQTLLQGQVRDFRFNLIAGQQFTATLTPISGDPDLYAWSSNGGFWKSDQDGAAVDTISFTVPTTGTYLVEVSAFSPATYSLTVSINGAAPVEVMRVLQPDLAKPIPAAPILPVSSEPEQQAGLPPVPVPTNVFLYMSLVNK